MRHYLMLAFLFTMLLASCISCATAPTPSMRGQDWLGGVSFYGRQSAEPSPLHRVIWDLVTECTGSDAGDYDSIQWEIATRLVDVEGKLLGGVWLHPTDETQPNIIILARDHWWSGLVISHELLHEKLGGDPYHLAPEWACVLR